MKPNLTIDRKVKWMAVIDSPINKDLMNNMKSFVSSIDLTTYFDK